MTRVKLQKNTKRWLPTSTQWLAGLREHHENYADHVPRSAYFNSVTATEM